MADLHVHYSVGMAYAIRWVNSPDMFCCWRNNAPFRFWNKLFITDETVHGGECTQAADSCTYPNAKCLGDGTCGCLDGLTFNSVGCCKYDVSKYLPLNITFPKHVLSSYE